MKDFYSKLKSDIEAYEGRYDDFIYLTPEWYKLMTNLLDDSRLPHRLKPMVSCAIAYFIIPADVISEEIHGPYGYIDDIFFCAFVADEIRKNSQKSHILVENWEGEGDILDLIKEVLDNEKKLIGDNRKLIFDYTGFSELMEWLGKKNKPLVPSEEERRKIVKKIIYEFEMLEYCYEKLSKSRSKNGGMQNLFIEGFLLHARILKGFFVDKKRKDDVSATDFVDSQKWMEVKSKLCYYLEENRERLNKYLAHLSYSRLQNDKQWEYKKIYDELVEAWKKFYNLLPEEYKELFKRNEKN